jgi:hypothetical protein
MFDQLIFFVRYYHVIWVLPLTLSLVCLVFAAYLKNKKIKLFFITMFSFFLALGIAEFTISKSRFGFHSVNFEMYKQSFEKPLYMPDGKYSISLNREVPGMRMDMYTPDTFYKTLDSEDVIMNTMRKRYSNGYPYTKGDSESDDVYIFLGCSFTEGHGVNWDETTPHYFSQHLNFKSNVLNFGRGGMGINFALNLLDTDHAGNYIRKSAKVKRVFYMFIEDHKLRAFRYYDSVADNIRLKNGKYTDAEKNILKKILSCSAIYTFFVRNSENTSEGYDSFFQNILEMENSVLSKYNAELTCVYWPCLNEKPNEKIISFFHQNNIDFVDLTNVFSEDKWFIEGDGHPTPAAHKVAAEVLYNHIKGK